MQNRESFSETLKYSSLLELFIVKRTSLLQLQDTQTHTHTLLTLYMYDQSSWPLLRGDDRERGSDPLNEDDLLVGFIRPRHG